MLHGFKISGGDVRWGCCLILLLVLGDESRSYSNKFVATTQRKAALRTGTLAGFKTFAGLDPCESIMGHAQVLHCVIDAHVQS